MKALMVAALVLLPSVALAEVGPPPPMSKADKDQMSEDMRIIQKTVRVVKDDDVAARKARLASCVTHWKETLSSDRHPDARKFLLGIRIARCMYRTHYTIIHGPCHPFKVASRDGWRVAVGLAIEPGCYAKFDKEVAPVVMR